MERLRIGEKIESTVVAVTEDAVFIALNAKSEGVISATEFSDGEVRPGDKITAYYMGEQNGEPQFSVRIAGDTASKDMLRNAFESGIPVEGRIEQEIKGGYEVKIGGARAFCPYSQIGARKRAAASDIIGSTLTFKIQEYKSDGRSIIVSNRAIDESLRLAAMARLRQELAEGATVRGTVTELRDYGAFMDIQGFSALLPVSEISYERVSDISKVLRIGQELTVSVIKADWQNERVSVSLKALLKNPWDFAAERYQPGSKKDGTVSRIADFGLFVTLEPGIDGLVHRSELADVDANTNLKKAYKIGAPFSVVVSSVDSKNKRISLRPASSSEQDKSTAQYLSAQDDDGGTYNPFAALLRK